MSQKRPNVAIAGVSGFVGKALAKELAAEYNVIGLSRHSNAGGQEGVSAWRVCDLFSLKQAEEALVDVDFAIYLVHSMMPQAHMTQANFADLDLICADNFSRAAKKQNVKRIFYLGGLLPQTELLSQHLQSRLEVEKTLAAYDVPVTTLRAGLIIGEQGSSFEMMLKLVKRLPLMVLPKWTESLTQPIALSDVISYFIYCLKNPTTSAQTYDIGGPNVMTYLEMMKITAQLMGRHLRYIVLPFFSPRLSLYWIKFVTGASLQLVIPLIESLKHHMIVENFKLIEQVKLAPCDFSDSVKKALEQHQKLSAYKHLSSRSLHQKNLQKDVRSVQRLPLPPGKSATWVAEEYLKWLPNIAPFFLRVDLKADGECRFMVRFFNVCLLVLQLSAERSFENRPIFYIRGGILARKPERDRLEFREVLDRKYVLAAIHDYKPSLPWILYYWTQAKFHLYVMKKFRKYLQKIGT